MARRLPRGNRPLPKLTHRAIPIGDGGEDKRDRPLFVVSLRVKLTNRADRRTFAHMMKTAPFGAERIGVSDHYCGSIDPTRPMANDVPQGAVVTSDGLIVYRDGVEDWELWGDHDELTPLRDKGYPWVIAWEYVTDARIQGIGAGSGPEKVTRGLSRPSRPRIDPEELSQEIRGVVHADDTRAAPCGHDETARKVNRQIRALGLSVK